MNVLFVSSEVAPFAKSGGLADVSAALPRQLHAAGHDVRIVMPMYPRVRNVKGAVFVEAVNDLVLQLGTHTVHFSIWVTHMPGTTLPVYMVRCPGLYDRPSLYGQAPDEHLRFIVLSYAAFKVAQHTGFAPDVIHTNDWQTGLVPLLLRTRFAWDKLFSRTKTVLTIHNLGHQGAFPSSILQDTGLADSRHLFHQEHLAQGRLGLLATGLLYADAITTVSPTYAREIQTPDQGVGLDDLLRARRSVLSGILNGIDDEEWNPAADPHLMFPFHSTDLDGKERNKKHLLSLLKLPYRREVPVIGLVSRLVWQKGLDLVTKVMPTLLQHHKFQLVVLGKGEPKYADFFRSMMRAFPHKVWFDAGFNEGKAHLIEAGADLFLMPSRYEPCGLNQMYSLRYGTVPIVHKTGGLADTVWNFNEHTGRGTGFVFENFDEGGLSWAVKHALHVWGTGEGAYRKRWQGIMRNGMDLPLGWRHRLGRYVEIYEELVPEARAERDGREARGAGARP